MMPTFPTCLMLHSFTATVLCIAYPVTTWNRLLLDDNDKRGSSGTAASFASFCPFFLFPLFCSLPSPYITQSLGFPSSPSSYPRCTGTCRLVLSLEPTGTRKEVHGPTVSMVHISFIPQIKGKIQYTKRTLQLMFPLTHVKARVDMEHAVEIFFLLPHALHLACA